MTDQPGRNQFVSPRARETRSVACGNEAVAVAWEQIGLSQRVSGLKSKERLHPVSTVKEGLKSRIGFPEIMETRCKGEIVDELVGKVAASGKFLSFFGDASEMRGECHWTFLPRTFIIFVCRFSLNLKSVT